MLTGQPDRRFGFRFPGTFESNKIACKLQVKLGSLDAASAGVKWQEAVVIY